MAQDLIKYREEVVARADRALDAVWPARMGDSYVREMRWAAGELEKIAAEMQAKGVSKVEQSRTYRLLGSIHDDLGPALGKGELQKARKAYQTAEAILEGQTDEFERAKLNFNFANTLRQLDPNDIDQLRESKQRLLAARAYFAANATQYLAQTDTALQSVEGLLRIAPLSNAVKKNTDDMSSLQKALEGGGNVSEIAKKTKEVMKRDGGAAGMLGSLQAIIDTLPDDQKQNTKFGEIQQQVQHLSEKIVAGKEMAPEIKLIWSLLAERLKSEISAKNITPDRAASLRGILEEFGRALSADEEDIPSLLSILQRIREFLASKFEMAHYLSHGIERPPEGSRAAQLVELSWQLRRYLLEEMNRSEKGEEESKEVLDLNIREARVDKRIYEAGANAMRALTVEKEELRPLALTVRNFSLRWTAMQARPIWKIANIPVDTNAVFYSGTENGKAFVARACHRSGLELLPIPKGESYATARWKQLQKAVTTVFDLRAADGAGLAAITYELGIALTIGKPVVVLVSEDQIMPFDVDVDPFVIVGKQEEDDILADAIDQSVYWTYPRPRSNALLATLDNVFSLYRRPQQNIYADQMLAELTRLYKAPDSLAINRALVKFFDYLNDGETMLIHPRWLPAYSDKSERRLFHVMPFRPEWAVEVTAITRKVCVAAGVTYIRGDEVDEPNVIRSIWEEIARATHILVDLTGFNANVALELGIAHTLGKKVLLTGQGDTVSNLFPSISKERIKQYDINKLQQTLGHDLRSFIGA